MSMSRESTSLKKSSSDFKNFRALLKYEKVAGVTCKAHTFQKYVYVGLCMRSSSTCKEASRLGHGLTLARQKLPVMSPLCVIFLA